MAIARRWWPIPVAIVLSVLVQTAAYTGRYDVSGHAAEHLSSGSFVFLAMVVAGVLLWTTPAARRSPFVLVGLALWLGAGVAIAIGNVASSPQKRRRGQRGQVRPKRSRRSGQLPELPVETQLLVAFGVEVDQVPRLVLPQRLTQLEGLAVLVEQGEVGGAFDMSLTGDISRLAPNGDTQVIVTVR